MFLKLCKKCGCAMDAGEGQNGVCDDCITGETEQQKRRAEFDRMVRTTEFKQMDMEEFIK